MKALLFLWSAIISSFVFFQTTNAFAQKIYLLAFGDPTDPVQSDVFKEDVGRILETFGSQGTDVVEFYNNCNGRASIMGGTPKWGGKPLYLGDDKFSRNFFSQDDASQYEDSSYSVFDRAIEAIENCPAGSDDTLVVYWTGHGVVKNGEHYLIQSNGAAECSRKELLRAAEGRGARLTALITDSCAELVSNDKPYVDGELSSPSAPPYGLSPLFEELFFNYQGTLDVNAASPPQRAFSYLAQTRDVNSGFVDLSGGCFSLALTSNQARWYPFFRDMPQWMRSKIQYDELGFGAFDVFARETPSWSEFLQYVDKTTDFVFQQTPAASVQSRQTVWVRETPTRIPGRPKPKLNDYLGGGLNDKFNNFNNFDDLDWSSSATTHPENGDRIIEINGQTIRDAKDVYAEVAASPSKIVLKLVDHRSGRVFYLRTTLYPGSYRSRLGLYVADSSQGGAEVTDYVSGYPITKCQYAWENSGGSDGSSSGDSSDYDDDFDNLNWSSTPTAHPENGDRLIEINGQKVRNAKDVYAKVAASPTTIILKFVDHKTGRSFYMRTKLYPASYKSRLGLYVADSPQGGAKVTGYVSGYPITKCQYAWE